MTVARIGLEMGRNILQNTQKLLAPSIFAASSMKGETERKKFLMSMVYHADMAVGTMTASILSGKTVETKRYVGTSPPLNSMVNRIKNIMPFRCFRYFLESGYAHIMQTTVESAVPVTVMISEFNIERSMSVFELKIYSYA